MFYCRSKFRQAGTDAGIFAAVEEPYLLAPIATGIYVKAAI